MLLNFARFHSLLLCSYSPTPLKQASRFTYVYKGALSNDQTAAMMHVPDVGMAARLEEEEEEEA